MTLGQFLSGRAAVLPNPTATVWTVERHPAGTSIDERWEPVAEYTVPPERFWQDLRPSPDTGVCEGDLLRLAEPERELTRYAFVVSGGAVELPAIDRMVTMTKEVRRWGGTYGSNWLGAWARCPRPWWLLELATVTGLDPGYLVGALLALCAAWPIGTRPEDPALDALLAQADALLDAGAEASEAACAALVAALTPLDAAEAQVAARVLSGRGTRSALEMWRRACLTTAGLAHAVAQGRRGNPSYRQAPSTVRAEGPGVLIDLAVAIRRTDRVLDGAPHLVEGALVEALRARWLPLPFVLRAWMAAEGR